MKDTDREIINTMTRQIIKIHKATTEQIKLLEGEEIKLELLDAIYRTSPKSRAYLELAMDHYSRAVFEKKTEILMDGLRKLGKIIFQDEKDEGA